MFLDSISFRASRQILLQFALPGMGFDNIYWNRLKRAHLLLLNLCTLSKSS